MLCCACTLWVLKAYCLAQILSSKLLAYWIFRFFVFNQKSLPLPRLTCFPACALLEGPLLHLAQAPLTFVHCKGRGAGTCSAGAAGGLGCGWAAGRPIYCPLPGWCPLPVGRGRYSSGHSPGSGMVLRSTELSWLLNHISACERNVFQESVAASQVEMLKGSELWNAGWSKLGWAT